MSTTHRKSWKEALGDFAKEHEKLLGQLPHPKRRKGSALDYVRWALDNANDWGCKTVLYRVEDAVEDHGTGLERIRKEEERIAREKARRERAKNPVTLDPATREHESSRHEPWDRVSVYTIKLREGLTRETADENEIRADVHAMTYIMIGFSVRGQHTFEWVDDTTIRYESWYPIGD